MNSKNYNLKRNIQLAFRRHVACLSLKSKYSKLFPHSAREYNLHFESIKHGYIERPFEFDHIIPVCFFDLTNNEDIRLAYSKYNISVTSRNKNKIKGVNVDTQTIVSYFEYMDLINMKTDTKIINQLIQKAKLIQSQNYLNEFMRVKKSIAV